MTSYVEYVKEFINDNLPEYEGQSIYGCDLAYAITESINVDGTATYNTYEAKQYIKEWFDEAVDVYQYQVDNYGQALHNPFENPEAFMVCMIIEGVSSILGQCEVVNDDDVWNYETEWTEELINKILEYVKTVDEIQF